MGCAGGVAAAVLRDGAAVGVPAWVVEHPTIDSAIPAVTPAPKSALRLMTRQLAGG